MQRDKAGIGALFSPMADTADMMAVSQCDNAGAVLLGPFDPDFHCFVRNRLTQTEASIKHNHCFKITHHRRMHIQHSLAKTEIGDVERDHADAV